MLSPWAFLDKSEARSKAFKFGEVLGCKTNDSKELLEYLMKLSPKDLVEGTDKALTDEVNYFQ